MAYRTNATCDPFRAWNRLEPRPRAQEFERVLSAEIHDALWMITRQWQFGELQGEDTGSAVFAKVQMETTRLTRFKNRQSTAVPYDDSIPLETRVERMPVNYDLRFRARAGQFFLKLLAKSGAAYNDGLPAIPYDHAHMKAALVALYPFELPSLDPDNDSTVLQIAKMKLLTNKLAHQALSGLSGRSVDGVLLYKALTSGGSVGLPPNITGLGAYSADFSVFMNDVADSFVKWFDNSHEVPSGTEDHSWQPSNLEYSFSCAAPNKGAVDNTIVHAEEFFHGHLDWYSFDLNLKDEGVGLGDLDEGEEESAVISEVFSLIPSEAQFGGMPNSRWWEFEDGHTDFGNLTAETTNLAKILLAEFALMYSNDWFVVPYTVSAGSISEVKGIVVTDTFGEHTLIEAAGQGDADDWTAWTMFNLSKTTSSEGQTGKVDPRVFIPPAVHKALESKPLEEIEMLRDEMANMVWGVETLVPDLLGGGWDGNGAAQALNNRMKSLSRSEEVVSEIPEGVKLKYELGNSVPENWIPFLPVHLPGQNRQIQLQRASMPRWFNDEFTQIRPRTMILREGMHDDDSTAEYLYVNAAAENQDTPFFVYEEEVTRSGILLQSSWQRTRWYDGKTVIWYGHRKKTYRGEGASGLAFDRVIDVDYDNQEALVSAEE